MTTKQTQAERTLHYQGLTAAQVEESRRKHGSNMPTPPARKPWWQEYLEKFNDPVIRILMVAAAVAIGLGWAEGSYVEGIGIVIAVLLATTLSFVNEFRANREFDILNQINEEVPVQVIREGRYERVPRRDLVVGDIVLTELGEEIPADGKVLEAVSFLVDESRLTGESHPVNKYPASVAGEQGESTYPRDVVLRGSLVSDGHATLELTAVGDHTEIGHAARAAVEETTEASPLNIQLEQLSKLIGVIGFSVAFLIFAALTVRGYVLKELAMTTAQWLLMASLAVGVLVALVRIWLPIVYDAWELVGKQASPPEWLEQGGLLAWGKNIAAGAVIVVAGGLALWAAGWLSGAPSTWIPAPVSREFLEYFMISVTIIVVAVPEGLAMSVTLSLAYSMRKMTRMNNLVRRMVACETIGAATVVCSDKTGTLTQNQMRVHDAVFSFPSDDTSKESEKNQPPSELVAEAMAANSTANLSRGSDAPTTAIGNPTESALLLWLEQHDVDYLGPRDNFSIQRQFTFSTERKYMATLGYSPVLEANVLHVKGAPEILLERATLIVTPTGESPLSATQKQAIQEQIREYARRGMRTLAFGYRRCAADGNIEDPDAVCQELVWLGFVALVDPIRPDARDAVQTCLDAGISIKIVTGDNSETAKEVAHSIGLLQEKDDPHQHLTGAEFYDLSDQEAKAASQSLVVLSRARPLHKLRLVRLLQEQNHVVAVTGDGSNDAPALNHAQVGLAMGTGTAVAKEASDIILLDDSFRSITNAVLWGRSLYLNIQKFILFQLTINVTALTIALLGPFINVKLPLTVMQMLWVNLIMDTFAALALATEPPHSAVMKHPPRDPKSFIITPGMAWHIFLTGGGFVVILLALLLYLQRGGLTSYELSFFFTAFVLLQFWNLFNARAYGSEHSAFSKLTGNPSFLIIAIVLLVGQILIVHLGGDVFRTVPLSLRDWLLLAAATSVILWVGEIRRWLTPEKA